MPLPPLGRLRLRPRAMTPQPSFFDDIHTHGRTGARVLTSVTPDFIIDTEPGTAWYSIGIHPWDTETMPDDAVFDRLEALAADPRVAAIGEAGLDALHGGPADVQEAVFRRQAAIAEATGKFFIIHCVRRYGRLMELKNELQPTVPWIIHGFRGKRELARQLLAAGFGISIGKADPHAIREAFPDTHFYSETDMYAPT